MTDSNPPTAGPADPSLRRLGTSSRASADHSSVHGVHQAIDHLGEDKQRATDRNGDGGTEEECVDQFVESPTAAVEAETDPTYGEPAPLDEETDCRPRPREYLPGPEAVDCPGRGSNPSRSPPTG